MCALCSAVWADATLQAAAAGDAACTVPGLARCWQALSRCAGSDQRVSPPEPRWPAASSWLLLLLLLKQHLTLQLDMRQTK